MSNSGPSTSSGPTEVKPSILEEKLQRSDYLLMKEAFRKYLNTSQHAVSVRFSARIKAFDRSMTRQ